MVTHGFLAMLISLGKQRSIRSKHAFNSRDNALHGDVKYTSLAGMMSPRIFKVKRGVNVSFESSVFVNKSFLATRIIAWMQPTLFSLL